MHDTPEHELEAAEREMDASIRRMEREGRRVEDDISHSRHELDRMRRETELDKADGQPPGGADDDLAQPGDDDAPQRSAS